MSNRSAPYTWKRITAGGEARVSIGGHELPFTSTSAEPVFASDISGAEWTVTPKVRDGAVALVLTAPDQTENLGFVESVKLTNAGSGYTAVPTVTFEAPPSGGTMATGTAVGPGGVASVTMTEEGEYHHNNHVPTVTFGAPPSGGTRATGTPEMPIEVVTLTFTNTGSGYTSGPTATFSAPPPGGTRATATIHVSGGRVSSYAIGNGGSGYTSPPTVTFSGGGGSGAAATVGLARRRVTGVTITNRGSGYTAAPSVTFTRGGHVNNITALGTTVLQTGVTSVTVTNRGSGYSSPPAVTFSGGGGSGAAATAILAEDGNNQYQNLFWARHTLEGKQLLVELAD